MEWPAAFYNKVTHVDISSLLWSAYSSFRKWSRVGESCFGWFPVYLLSLHSYAPFCHRGSTYYMQRRLSITSESIHQTRQGSSWEIWRKCSKGIGCYAFMLFYSWQVHVYHLCLSQSCPSSCCAIIQDSTFSLIFLRYLVPVTINKCDSTYPMVPSLGFISGIPGDNKRIHGA